MEENIIKNVTNLFRLKKLKKETKNATIREIRNPFRLKIENKVIKDRILRDIRNLFGYEEELENHYKPVTMGNFWCNYYIEHERKGNINKTISVEKYINKIRSYLKDIMNKLNTLNKWKIQLIIAINFIFSKDNDEEHVRHSKSDNIEIMINDKANEVIKELFKLMKNRYQNNLEELMKGNDFVSDCIHLLYY